MNTQKLSKYFVMFIGNAKKNGATDEELDILVKAFGLIKKYPFKHHLATNKNVEEAAKCVHDTKLKMHSGRYPWG